MLPAAPAIQNTQSTLRPTISARNVEYTGCSQRLCIDKILQAASTRSAHERMCATRQAHGVRSAQKGEGSTHITTAHGIVISVVKSTSTTIGSAAHNRRRRQRGVLSVKCLPRVGSGRGGGTHRRKRARC